jgi:hypothetical protein
MHQQVFEAFAKSGPMDEYTAKRLVEVASPKSNFDAEGLGFAGPYMRAKQPYWPDTSGTNISNRLLDRPAFTRTSAGAGPVIASVHCYKRIGKL